MQNIQIYCEVAIMYVVTGYIITSLQQKQKSTF